MSHDAPGDAPGVSPERAAPGAASLDRAKFLLARSRLLGRVSAFIFLLAAFAVLDGLQTLVRHEFNSIDLVPGESVLVSGMMPAGAKSHEDLVVEIDGDPGLTFTPLETYKGFWMGGHMWRAELKAAPDMRPGAATVTVVDVIKPDIAEGQSYDDRDRAILFGGKQNPALVHGITVWASESQRRAADDSLFRRFTGIQPFVLAGLCVFLALVAGLGNWLVFCRAESALAEHGVFVIHGVKDMAVAVKQALPGQRILATSGLRVAFSRLGKTFDIGEDMLLMNREWQAQAEGRILDVERLKAHALFPEDGVRPRYGWLVARKGGE